MKKTERIRVKNLGKTGKEIKKDKEKRIELGKKVRKITYRQKPKQKHIRMKRVFKKGLSI